MDSPLKVLRNTTSSRISPGAPQDHGRNGQGGGSPVICFLVALLLTTVGAFLTVEHVPSAFSIDRLDARIALGRSIFFDTALSSDGKTSCATCHQPDHRFASPEPQAIGVLGRIGTRNAPSLLNVVEASPLFWEGRRQSLHRAVLDPFLNPVELALEDQGELSAKLRSKRYQQAFVQAFGLPAVGRKPLDELAGQALEAFLISLPRPTTPFDSFQASHDESRLSIAARKGLRLFVGKAGCSQCHTLNNKSFRLTDDKFHPTGTGLQSVAEDIPALARRLESQKINDVAILGHVIETDASVSALGRFVITGKPSDIGLFRTPSLRYVAQTGPYMHDGSIEDLATAVDQEIYWRSLGQGTPLLLTVRERHELIAFLESL